jgi:diguanylate cyclase (GGDEF)-like protein/PAS domain S-box-containing protein
LGVFPGYLYSVCAKVLKKEKPVFKDGSVPETAKRENVGRFPAIALAALCMMAGSLLLRGLGWQFDTAPSLFVLLCPILSVVAIHWGFWPGISGTLLGVSLMLVWGSGHQGYPLLPSPREGAAIGLLLLMGILISVLAERHRRQKAAPLEPEKPTRESLDLLHLFVDHTPVALAMFDREMRYLGASLRWVDDYRLEREDLIGRSHYELFPEITEEWKAIHRRGLAGETVNCDEDRFVRKDGNVQWLRWVVQPWRQGNGEVGGIVVFSEDITERKRTEEALRSSEARYRTAFQTSLDAISISRVSDRKYIEVNQSFLDITGFSREEVLGRTPAELKIWVDPTDRGKLLKETEENRACRDFEMKFRRKGGEISWGLISASTTEIDGQACLLAVIRDISAAKRAEEEIRSLAFFDPLTGLANRRLLMERLSKSMAFSNRTHRKRALLFVDLDDFKKLNDTMGHQTGDMLLREVANRLTACVREVDTVSRLGGDEFVILLEDLNGSAEAAASDAQTIAEKVLTNVAQPYTLDGHECASTCSIGITVFGDMQQNINEIMQQADIAMYQAKSVGRNTMRFFAPALQAAVNARAVLEEELRQGIKMEQFQLYYQPQIEAGRIVGAEALLRWKHPRLGTLSPGEFILLAEASRLILPLGAWVLEEACRQIAAWSRHEETAGIVVAVNVSALQLRMPDFIGTVLGALERTGATPANLVLEFTEAMLVDNVEDVHRKMMELKGHGVHFSVDDFGSGYSSLSHLKRLPIDQFKIGRTFTRDLLENADSGAIAQTILALGEAMLMSVIAEGVETAQQRDYLARIGCHAYQGFLFSRPLPVDEFETWVRLFGHSPRQDDRV